MFDIKQSVHNRHGELDSDLARKYEEGLTKAFAASPEAQGLPDPGAWTSMMLHYALDYIGVTPPEMSLRDFNEVLFELFPRKVSTEPGTAPEIVAELRAFWRFLQREYGLPNAAEVLAALDDKAVVRLQKDLANPANYGMAKSFFMLGSQGGFDMTTQEGMNAFMLAYNSGQFGGGPSMLPGLAGLDEDADGFDSDDLPPLPGSPATPPKSREQRRKERKRQRQARKRNRR